MLARSMCSAWAFCKLPVLHAGACILMPHAGLILSTCKLLCCVTSTLYLGAAVCLALVRLSLQLKHNKHRWVALTTTNILRIPQALSTAVAHTATY